MPERVRSAFSNALEQIGRKLDEMPKASTKQRVNAVKSELEKLQTKLAEHDSPYSLAFVADPDKLAKYFVGNRAAMLKLAGVMDSLLLHDESHSATHAANFFSAVVENPSFHKTALNTADLVEKAKLDDKTKLMLWKTITRAKTFGEVHEDMFNALAKIHKHEPQKLTDAVEMFYESAKNNYGLQQTISFMNGCPEKELASAVDVLAARNKTSNLAQGLDEETTKSVLAYVRKEIPKQFRGDIEKIFANRIDLGSEAARTAVFLVKNKGDPNLGKLIELMQRFHASSKPAAERD